MKPESYGGILEVSAAIRDYYGLEHSADCDPAVSAWLREHQFRCVIALLVDGMGISIMKRHLKEQSFFMRHTVKEITTVFPPTTTAATTSFLTGKYPCETGWLGWNQYFREINDELILFRDTGQYSGKIYPDHAWKALPVTYICDELNRKNICARSFWPEWAGTDGAHTYHQLMERTLGAAENPEVRMIYTYWDVLDTCMHVNGPFSSITKRVLENIEHETERMAQALPEDCGLLVIADHSQVEVRHYVIDDDDEFCSYLSQTPTVEARCISLCIKPEKKEAFRTYFNKKFGNAFLLLDHDEVIRQGWFGKGTPHPRFEEFIGDYIAIALGPLQLDFIRGKDTHGSHAGGMASEAMIPLILVP